MIMGNVFIIDVCSNSIVTYNMKVNKKPEFIAPVFQAEGLFISLKLIF